VTISKRIYILVFKNVNLMILSSGGECISKEPDTKSAL
jgi:hypothetical protein